jgi:hypothetical protein
MAGKGASRHSRAGRLMESTSHVAAQQASRRNMAVASSSMRKKHLQEQGVEFRIELNSGSKSKSKYGNFQAFPNMTVPPRNGCDHDESYPFQNFALKGPINQPNPS